MLTETYGEYYTDCLSRLNKPVRGWVRIGKDYCPVTTIIPQDNGWCQWKVVWSNGDVESGVSRPGTWGEGPL